MNTSDATRTSGSLGAFTFGLLTVRLVWAMVVFKLWVTEASSARHGHLLAVSALVLVPVAAGWLVADHLRLRCWPKVFDPRRVGWGSHVARALVGVWCGAAGIGLSIVLVPLAAGVGLDWFVDGVATAVACGVGLALLQRVRPGACFRCDYPLVRAANGIVRCPECGCEELGGAALRAGV
jgi:hypothetical protein